MPHSAHVLVAATDDLDRGRLAVMLADSGYRVSAAASGQRAPDLVRALKPDVVVLGASPREADTDLGDLTGAIKAAGGDAATRVVIVARMLADAPRGRCVAAGADDVIEGPLHPAAFLARVKPLCRLGTMRTELRRRADTARAMGVDVVADPPAAAREGPCRVMVVAESGGSTEDAVLAALDDGFAATTEPDPYRAGAAVAAERYDAMVVAADGERGAAEPALYLASSLRNNPDLFDLPVMMLHSPGLFPDAGAPYRHGASIALGLPLAKAQLAAGLQVLVRRQRTRWAMRDAFETIRRAVVPAGQQAVFPEAFLIRHLQSAVEEAHREGRHLSVAIFSLRNLDAIRRKYFADAGEMLVAKAAAWIAGLVRAEDLVARLDADQLCAMLPDTAQEECVTAVQRIAAILSASDFHLTEEVMRPIRLSIDTGCAAIVPGDTAQAMLDRARAAMS
jgi:two-component system cell cycle response regulator